MCVRVPEITMMLELDRDRTQLSEQTRYRYQASLGLAERPDWRDWNSAYAVKLWLAPAPEAESLSRGYGEEIIEPEDSLTSRIRRRKPRHPVDHRAKV